MLKKINTLLTKIFFIFFGLIISVNKVFATAEFNASLEEARDKTGHTPLPAGSGSNYINGIIGDSIKILLSLVGIIFIVLIIYAGYTWMMARGNEAEAEKAKSTITRAIIGLFIVLSAYAITSFIGKSI